MRRKRTLTLLLLGTLAAAPMTASAHPGHDDPVTISRATHPYMQKIVPHYLTIQRRLAAGTLDDEARGAAEAIERLAKKAQRKESDPSGRKMYKNVVKSAAFIASAADLADARQEFAELSDALLPFFDHWPGHILEHDLVLYTCKETEQWWLQANGEKVADPYRGATVECNELTEKEE